ncbi:MAG: DUF4386 domain-containing protein [Bacteroidota bacterium]
MKTAHIHPQSAIYGRIAGSLYLVIAIIGFFSIMYVPGEIIADFAADTVQNLQEKANLFRWGIAADILTFSIELALTSMLFQIFKGQNETRARIATYARFAMIMVMGINLLVYLSPLLILENAELLESFEPKQINSLVALFFDIHATGILIWGIFFGIHLLLLGSLVIQSPQHPTLLGWLMLTGSFGYILESINMFCLAGNESMGMLVYALLGIVIVGEIGFAIWLIIKGIKAH